MIDVSNYEKFIQFFFFNMSSISNFLNKPNKAYDKS